MTGPPRLRSDAERIAYIEGFDAGATRIIEHLESGQPIEKLREDLKADLEFLLDVDRHRRS